MVIYRVLEKVSNTILFIYHKTVSHKRNYLAVHSINFKWGNNLPNIVCVVLLN